LGRWASASHLQWPADNHAIKHEEDVLCYTEQCVMSRVQLPTLNGQHVCNCQH
jgi:hypothetical protein